MASVGPRLRAASGALCVRAASRALCVAIRPRPQQLVQLGCIGPMVALLDVNDVATQKLVLDAITNLLGAGEELAKHKPGGANPFSL